MTVISPVASAAERVPEPVKGSVSAAAVVGAVISTIVGWTGRRFGEVLVILRRVTDFAVSSMRTLGVFPAVFLAMCFVQMQCYAEF